MIRSKFMPRKFRVVVSDGVGSSKFGGEIVSTFKKGDVFVQDGMNLLMYICERNHKAVFDIDEGVLKDWLKPMNKTAKHFAYFLKMKEEYK